MKELLKQMSLKQKVGQLNQKLYGWECYEIVEGEVELSLQLIDHINKYDGIGAIYGLFRADPWTNINYQTGLSYSQAVKLLNKIRRYIYENCSLPIMPLIVEEMPHGHQGLDAKCYPVNIAVGATFNPDLYREAIKEQLEYANYHHINIGLISGLDVARDSRWGRTEETFGADPYLSSMFTREIAKNFKNDKSVACLKHFAAQGAPYMGLNSGAVNIGEREFREIHLPPTREAAKYSFDLIMAAYNEIDGVPCHANKWLLESVLRDELGFTGIVMADGQALNRLISKNIPVELAGKLALNAGVGLSLWDDVYLKLDQAVEKGHVNISEIDQKVIDILNLKNKLNLTNYHILDEETLTQTDEVNYKLAAQSVILQKNSNNYFPIDSRDNCLFIGDTFDSLYTFLGDYTAFQDTEKYKNLKQLITEEMKNSVCISIQQGLEMDTARLKQFDRVIVIGGGTSARDFGMEFEENGALKFGNGVTDSGENVDLGSIVLTDIQYQICSKLTQENIEYGFICIQGRPYALKEICKSANGIISTYYNGQQGPQALLDIILGKVNPSGKNPISMPFYPEYFGYEYNSKQDMRNQSYTCGENECFEFGHGLSYGELEYSGIRISNQKLIVDVANYANNDVLETVQIYIKKENSLIVKRRRELVDFKKISIPSKTTIEVSFNVVDSWFTSLDLKLQPVIEKGCYQVIVGTGEKVYQSIDIKR